MRRPIKDQMVERIQYQPPKGVTPSIILVNPKHAHNAGMVVRLASCFGFKQVWFTGNRITEDLEVSKRLPREERMKGYKEVDIINYDYPFDAFGPDVIPIAIEVRPQAELLHQFEHPENAVYVFGPEDGSIPTSLIRHCHRFVVIPTKHCLNLATAATAILWDRTSKLGGPFYTPGEFEQRGFAAAVPDLTGHW